MPDWSLKRIWHIYVFILHCYCAVSAMSLWDYMVRKHKSRLVLWLFRIYFFFFFFFFLFSNCFINRWLLRPSVCAITNQPNLLLAQNVMFWLENFSFRSLFHIYKLNYEQFAISYFCMQFNLAELWMHTLKRKEEKLGLMLGVLEILIPVVLNTVIWMTRILLHSCSLYLKPPDSLIVHL